MAITIRPETAADITAIETLTAAAFLNAPHTSHTEQFIVNALRIAGQLTLSLVAEEDSKVVGTYCNFPGHDLGRELAMVWPGSGICDTGTAGPGNRLRTRAAGLGRTA